jgi:hypothetical protein
MILNLLSFDLGIDNVKIEHSLNFEMPKRVFSQSFTKIE